MENLKEKIEKDFQEALKKGDKIAISTLKLLKTAIFDKELEKKYMQYKEKEAKVEKQENSLLTNEEIQKVIFSEIKKRKETISELLKYAKKGQSEDKKIKEAIEKENLEIEILKRYLPPLLSEEEISILATTVINEIGAKEAKDIGKVIKIVMEKTKGMVDGALVSETVKKILFKK